jgi:Zinc knuckle
MDSKLLVESSYHTHHQRIRCSRPSWGQAPQEWYDTRKEQGWRQNGRHEERQDGNEKLGEKTKFEGECYNCGKYGHRKADCGNKAKTKAKLPKNTRYTKMSQPQGEADKRVSFYLTFGSTPNDGDEEHNDRCIVTLIGLKPTGGCQTSLRATKTSIQPISTVAISIPVLLVQSSFGHQRSLTLQHVVQPSSKVFMVRSHKLDNLVTSDWFTLIIEQRCRSSRHRISFYKDIPGSSNVETMLIVMLSCTCQSRLPASHIEIVSTFATWRRNLSIDA